MLNRYEHGGVTWIDLESPTREEVQRVASEFSLEPMIAEELLQESSKPRAERRRSYIYLVLHFPALRHSHKSKEQEVDFVIGKNFLITTHYDLIDPLHKFSKLFEVNSLLEKGGSAQHAGFLFYFMLKKLYQAVEHELEHATREQQVIENHIFAGHEVQMVEAISNNARTLLNLRQTIEPHRDILHSLEEEGTEFYGSDFTQYLRGLSNEYFRVHNHIMRSTESLHELRETNNSLLSTKQNETMRVLTIMALLTFPLSLMVSLFDINVIDNPFNYVPHGFWIIVASVLVVGALMLVMFKRKKWL